MEEKIKIKNIVHYNTDKSGNYYLTKDGRRYTRCVITTEDGRVMSGFGSKFTRNLKEGDEVELEVIQSGEYLNFKVPKVDIYSLEKRIKVLEEKIEELSNIINEL